MACMACTVPLLLALSVSCCLGWRVVSSECGASGWSVPSPPSGLALRQVNAVIRHGDRTPWSGDYCWPDDSSVWDCQLTSGEVPMYTDTQYGKVLPRIYRKIYSFGDETLHGNCSVAQLTTFGFEQHTENGRMLNKAYVNGGFLNKTLDNRQIYLRSDDVSRTLLSAQSLLLGMYPPSETASSTESMEIHTMDPTYEYMVANPVLCPRYGSYSNTFNKSEAWTKHYSVTKALLTEIHTKTNYSIKDADLIHYADCLRTHMCHKLDLPQGMTEDLYSQVWEEVSWQFYNLYKYPSVEENARAGIGFLLKELWQNMNATVMGKPREKFLLYSGHDTTLMPLLVALQADDGAWPLYASMMLIELYENTTKSAKQNVRHHSSVKSSKFLVRVVYNGKVLKLPFCKNQELCDFQDLSYHMSTVTPADDFSKQCSLSEPEQNVQKWKF